MKIWKIIDECKKNNENIMFASLDIKGAYDNVSHEYLNDKFSRWMKDGYVSENTVERIRFLYNQYKLGFVEDSNTDHIETCLVNIGLPQGSRLSCNAFNGVQDSLLKRMAFILAKNIKDKRPDLSLETIKHFNDLLAFADDTLIASKYVMELRRTIDGI